MDLKSNHLAYIEQQSFSDHDEQIYHYEREEQEK